MIKYDLLVHLSEKMTLDGTRGIDLVVSAYSGEKGRKRRGLF